MSETFNTESVELYRERGHIDPNELLRLSIKTDSPSSKLPCEDKEQGTFQHVMIHDRWLNHIETCDDCKEHILRLVMDLNKRIKLFSPTMLKRLIAAVPPGAFEKDIADARLGPELAAKLKAAL